MLSKTLPNPKRHIPLGAFPQPSSQMHSLAPYHTEHVQIESEVRTLSTKEIQRKL